MRALASCKLYKTNITTPSHNNVLQANRKITVSSSIRNTKSLVSQKSGFITSYGLHSHVRKSFCTTTTSSVTKDELNPHTVPVEITTSAEQSQITTQEIQSEQVINVQHVAEDVWGEKIKNLDEHTSKQAFLELFDEFKSANAKIGVSEYERLVKLCFKKTYPRSDDFLFILDHAKQNSVELPSDIIGKCLVGYSYSKSAQSTAILGRISELKMKNIEPHSLWHEAVIRGYCGEKDTEAIKNYISQNELVLEDSHLKLAVATFYLIHGKKEEFTEMIDSIKASLKETLYEDLLTELTIKHEAPQQIVQFREQMTSERTGISFQHIEELLNFLHETKRDETWVKLFIVQLQLQIRASQKQMDFYLQKLESFWNQKKRLSHAPVILSALQNKLIDIKDEAFHEKMIQYFGKWNEMEVVKTLVPQYLTLFHKRPGIQFHKTVLTAYQADSDVIGAFGYWDRLGNEDAPKLLQQMTQIMTEAADIPQLERYVKALEKKSFATMDEQLEVYERLVLVAAKRGYTKNLIDYVKRLQDMDNSIPVNLSALAVPVLVKKAEWRLASELVSDLKEQVGYRYQAEAPSAASKRALQLLLEGEGNENTEAGEEPVEQEVEEQPRSLLSPEDTATAFNTILFRHLYLPKDTDWKQTLSQMQARNIPVSLASFNEILRFCVKKRISAEDAFPYYDQMRTQGVVPDVETFGLLRVLTKSLPNFFWAIPAPVRDKLRLLEKLTPTEVEKLAKSLTKAVDEMELAKLKAQELDLAESQAEEVTEGIHEEETEGISTEPSPDALEPAPSSIEDSTSTEASPATDIEGSTLENPASTESTSTDNTTPSETAESTAPVTDSAVVTETTISSYEATPSESNPPADQK